MDKYKLLTDAYFGTGLFENGAGLRQHPREDPANYRDRQGLAYYLNYTGPIVNAAVDPIFKNDIKRDYNGSTLFQAFLDDCDRTGTDYQDFCKSAALQAKLYGVAYIVVDNSDELAERRSDAVAGRKLPFLKIVTPAQIKNWAIDRYGRLTMFQYTETSQVGANAKNTETYTWTQDSWAIGNGDGKTTGSHNMGCVPVVQWLARNTDRKIIKPPSEYLSVAQANYFLYQLCSWHTQLLRDQAFGILTMPDDGSGEVTVGTNNALIYPADASHTPDFIAPPAAPAEMLTEQMDRIIKEMFRMSGLDSVIGVQSDKSKSGVAKQWDFEKTNKRLADFAVRCEDADEAIVRLFEKWSGETVDYNCEYPRDFKINDVVDSLSNAAAALELGFDSPTYKLEVLKKVLEAYMPNLPPETYDKMIEEVAAAIEEGKQNSAYEDGDVDDPDGNGQDD